MAELFLFRVDKPQLIGLEEVDMRTRFLLCLCLAAMPLALVGCDGGGGNVVGTGSKEPPPDVKARIEEQNKMYQKIQEESLKNPPGSGNAPAPGGG